MCGRTLRENPVKYFKVTQHRLINCFLKCSYFFLSAISLFLSDTNTHYLTPFMIGSLSFVFITTTTVKFSLHKTVSRSTSNRFSGIELLRKFEKISNFSLRKKFSASYKVIVELVGINPFRLDKK